LEWLIEIVPSAKRIYVPYDPKDGAGVKSLQTLTDTAATLGAELVVAEGPTPDELDSITQTIPENIDAVFALRSAAIGSRITNLVQAATARGIPVVTGDIGSRIDSGALLGYGPGYYEMGQQAASLAEKLLKGGKPAELPVEASETYLGINLQTADALGIEISDEVLKQAKQVVHAP
jgi:putative ABC transport system substrate-binding protein